MFCKRCFGKHVGKFVLFGQLTNQNKLDSSGGGAFKRQELNRERVRQRVTRGAADTGSLDTINYLLNIKMNTSNLV